MDDKPASGIDYLRLLRRLILNRWRALLLGLLLVALPAAAGVIFFLPNMYEASATLFVIPAQEELASQFGLGPSQMHALHLVTLKSRSLAQAVLDSLPRESRNELLNRAMLRDYLLPITNATRRLRGEQVIVYDPREQMLRELRDARMRFSFADDGTVTVSAVAFNPLVAMDLVNTYVDVLLTRTSSYAREQAGTARTLIEGLLARARKTHLETEDALRKFQLRTGGWINLPDQASLSLSKFVGFDSALSDVQIEREIAEAELAFLRGESEKSAKAKPPSLDVASERLRGRLNELEDKLAVLAEKYTDQHPLILGTRSEIEDTRERLRATLRGQQVPKPSGAIKLAPAEAAALSSRMADLEVRLLSLQAREESIRRRMAGLRSSLSALSNPQLEYSELSRVAEGQRNLLGILSEKLTAARLGEQLPIRGIQVIDYASLPHGPSPKQGLKVVLISLLAGLGLGAGIGILRERAHEVILTEDDVVRATGLPVLGSVPIAQPAKPRAGPNGPLHFLEDPGPLSLEAEVFRTIRSALQMRESDLPLKVLLVTSPGAGEGKTTTLLNLASVFLETNRRVLLIDADLRRSSLHQALKVPNEVGLADMLQDDQLVPAGCRTVADHLQFIPSGLTPSNPGGLLSSQKMAKIVDLARHHADVILVDSPPVLAVPDSIPLTPLVDGILLVVRSGVTRRSSLVRAKSQLEKVRARIVGVVVNGLSRRESRRHYAEYAHYVGAVRTSRRRSKQ